MADGSGFEINKSKVESQGRVYNLISDENITKIEEQCKKTFEKFIYHCTVISDKDFKKRKLKTSDFIVKCKYEGKDRYSPKDAYIPKTYNDFLGFLDLNVLYKKKNFFGLKKKLPLVFISFRVYSAQGSEEEFPDS